METVPEEIKKGGNFGAFFLTFIWGLFHKVWITLIIPLVIIVYFVINYFTNNKFENVLQWLIMIFYYLSMFYLLFKGNELAWKNMPNKSVQEFKRQEMIWAISGLMIFLIVILSQW